MPSKNRKTIDRIDPATFPNRPITLKELALHLGLSPTSLSLVLNGSQAASSIPLETQRRIFAAAKQFNYRPHFIARSLRAQRTLTVGVLVPELSDGYSAMVLSGVEDYLLEGNYFYFVASHRHRTDLIEKYQEFFTDRCVEGILAVATLPQQASLLPVVSISVQHNVPQVTNIALDHKRAATLALEHLVSLGHRKIAFIKGQEFSSDTMIRWQSINEAAARLKVSIHPDLVEQLIGNTPSPETGYVAAQKLLATGRTFTALFSFNDISAIGAIRALCDAGLRVPEDVSVVGFDDVHAAAFHNPPLTTIRQPLFQMGRLAAEHLLRRISSGPSTLFPTEVIVEPELIVRQSTAAIRSA